MQMIELCKLHGQTLLLNFNLLYCYINYLTWTELWAIDARFAIGSGIRVNCITRNSKLQEKNSIIHFVISDVCLPNLQSTTVLHLVTHRIHFRFDRCRNNQINGWRKDWSNNNVLRYGSVQTFVATRSWMNFRYNGPISIMREDVKTFELIAAWRKYLMTFSSSLAQYWSLRNF